MRTFSEATPPKPLEENEPYSAERLYVACASISKLAMNAIADTVDALGLEGGECSIAKAAKILNDFLLILHHMFEPKVGSKTVRRSDKKANRGNLRDKGPRIGRKTKKF